MAEVSLGAKLTACGVAAAAALPKAISLGKLAAEASAPAAALHPAIPFVVGTVITVGAELTACGVGVSTSSTASAATDGAVNIAKRLVDRFDPAPAK